jgi:hypothetical protein
MAVSELERETKALADEARALQSGIAKGVSPSQIKVEQVDDLADRLTGRGMQALRTDDWPILVLALEYLAASFTKPL